MEKTLVIGYGNTLRRDDGAGPEVARRVAELGLPNVKVVEAHQLLPEHAELLSRFDRAVFVDASVDEVPNPTGMETVTPDPSAELGSHAADPAGMLALAQTLFGHAPEAWLVALPATDLGIGEGLSPTTEEAVEQAVAVMRDFCASPA